MKLAFSSSIVIAWLAAAPDALQQVARARATVGDVHVVDDDGGAGVAFVDLQAAVDAAGDGDVILVRGGTYSGFIVDGKALTLQADTGATVDVESASSVPVNVVNLDAGQSVVLRGLHVEGGSLGIQNPFEQSYLPAFFATDNEGSVWVEDCRIRGTAGGAVVRDSPSVVFVRSRLLGLDLAGFIGFESSPGGAGLDCAGSEVHAYGCSMQGGAGGAFEGLSAREGGDGARIEDGFLFASDSSFTGGFGGGSVVECGDGGNGLSLGAGSPVVRTLGATLRGGGAPSGGFGASCEAGVGVLVQSGAHDTIPAAPLAMTTTSPVREGESVALVLEGPPGAQAFLTIGRRPNAAFRAGLNGSALVGRPRTTLRLGRIPPSGVLTTRAPLVPLRGPLGFRVQPSYVLGGSVVVLGEASAILGLPPPF